MEIKWKASPNYRSKLSTRKIMMHLTIALAVVYIFGLARSFYMGVSYGVNAIVMMVVGLVVAFCTEAIWAKAVKQDILTYVKNSFGWITAMIVVLACRNTTSPYAIAVGTFIGLFFGKLVYGGFGQNVFNPAAVGRAVILTSFPLAVITDAVAGATPTATLANAGWLMKSAAFDTYLSDFGGLANLWLGVYDGALGETSALLLVILAIYLFCMKVIDIRITLSYICTIFLGTTIIGLVNGVGIVYPLAFIATGGIFFAAVFMLTDPVTCPNTGSGKIVFGACAALFTVIIRLFANLPEGVVFSILLANLITPVIEKVFKNKQVDVEKKLNIFVPLFVLAVVLCISFCGSGLTLKNSYNSVANSVFHKTSGEAVTNEYEVQGFEYNPANKISVTVDGGEIVSISFSEFNDTQDIAGGVNTDEYLGQFVGLKSVDEVNAIDALSGATYTSNAVKKAAKLALEGAN